jgi:hypothetical protein
LLTVTAVVQAQDVIVKKDGNTILSKILEIGTKEIKYKKFNNQSGPTYTIEKENVSRINFENGTTETFDETDAVEDKSIEAQLQKLSQADDKLVKSLTPEKKITSPIVYEKRARTYRTIAIIGGVVLVAGVIGLASSSAWSVVEDEGYGGLGTVAAVAGGVLAVGFGTASVVQHKKAKQASSTTSYLFETEFFNKKLSANVNVVRTADLMDTAFGLGLKYNF